MSSIQYFAIQHTERMAGVQIMTPFLFPSEDKYITKRKRGVVLYTRPKMEREKPKKKIQMERRLCTAAYR